MTIANTPIVNSYIGTGGANSYSFSFLVFSSSDVAVVITSPTGTTYSLTLGTDFTVSGLNPSGGPPSAGSITLVNSSQAWLTAGNLTSAWIISVTRTVTIQQSSSIRNQGDFYQEFIENALDYIVMICQQLQQGITSPVLGTAFPSAVGNLTFLTNGAGFVLTTPNGLHTWLYAIDNDGILQRTQLS